MTIFMSLKSSTAFFFYGLIDWIFESLPLEMGRGGQMGKSTYEMGDRSKRACANDGGVGVKFLPLW